MNTLKKVMLTCSLILSYGYIAAQDIHFETGDWASVLKKSETTNKLIFIDIYTTWCGPCKWMDKTIFTNKDVADYFNSHFINYKLDAEKGEGINLSKTYAVNSYPNQLFVDNNGKLVVRHNGLLDVKGMLEFGARALNSKKEVTAMTLEYKTGNRTPEFIFKYLAFLKERELPTDEVLINYLEAFDKEQWLSDENLKLVKTYMYSPYNKIFEYLVKQTISNKNYFNPVSIYNAYLGRIIKERKAPEEISKLLSHANSRLDSKEDRGYLNYRAKMLTAKRDQDWDSYASHIIDYVNTYCLDKAILLNNYAYNFYEKDAITDPKVLNEALKWINIALKENYDYSFLDTKACVLYKLGKKEEALITANEALEAAKKSGQKVSKSTLELIEKIKAL